MADVRTPATDEGGADSAVVLAEVVLATAWNVRGDPERPPFVAEAERVLGLALPTEANASTRGAGSAVLWLGARSWLFVGGPGAARADFDVARVALNDADGALFDLSASHAAWTVAGAAALRVLNRSCPLDLHARAFPPGRCAQSLLGHINALFYRPDERAAFIVVVARSLAADAWRALRAAAATDGYRVAPAVPFGSA